MRITHTFANAFFRRSTAMSIVGAFVLMSWASSEVKAGVILPLAQENQPAMADFMYDGLGSSNVPEQPVPVPKEDRDGQRQLAGMRSLDGLVQAGGASVPVNNAGAQTIFAAGALCDESVSAPVTCSFAYLRETTPQLPQPPLGELLDPPKTCA